MSAQSLEHSHDKQSQSRTFCILGILRLRERRLTAATCQIYLRPAELMWPVEEASAKFHTSSPRAEGMPCSVPGRSTVAGLEDPPIVQSSMQGIGITRSSPSAEVMPCRVPCQGTVPGPGGLGGAGGGDGGMGGGLHRYIVLRHGCRSDICQSISALHE